MKRVRCQNCRAVLRKSPDVPEQIEFFSWDTIPVSEDRYSYPMKVPKRELVESQGTWSEWTGPFWTCQRCKWENDAEHIAQEQSLNYPED